MIPSDDKLRMMVRRAVDAVERDPQPLVVDPEGLKRGIKKAVEEGMALMGELDAIARSKVESLRRGVRQGTREYDELYFKYLSEERRKRGL